ncbi:uncharacterized protein [Maniola hyperantus]|uniref:uncharacterized protein isoform X1 n=1 Tax=Aphantopus hyperantus TaxID=2795564 RepID=UPI0015692402|nr:E3 ubiquitin-protein ligase Mdm2-like [Maniola hyperantus]
MNTTASYSSEPSWSRRCSTETIFSIQGKETDFVRDTSDTEWFGSDDDAGVEYEPASAPEDDGPLTGDSSGHSDNEIIATQVIEVSVGDDGELQLADSELTASSSDSEMDLHDYWLCAHCRAQNNNPMYRYCEKCFKERKNFFPPRPKRKRKRKLSTTIEPESLPRTLSQDSGVESVANSQELSQQDLGHSSQSSLTDSVLPKSFKTSTPGNTLIKTHLKRRTESAARHAKRFKTDYSDTESDTDSDTSESTNSKCNTKVNAISESKCNIKTEISVGSLVDIKTVNNSETNIDRTTLMLKNNIEVRPVAKMVSDSESVTDRSKSILNEDIQVMPLVKMVSDPALTIENTDVKLTKKVIVNTIKEKLDIESKDLCIVCSVEPKSGVFVHGRIAHICCCYKCAVKVWSKAKRCPVCNSKVSNVLKAIVM